KGYLQVHEMHVAVTRPPLLAGGGGAGMAVAAGGAHAAHGTSIRGAHQKPVQLGTNQPVGNQGQGWEDIVKGQPGVSHKKYIYYESAAGGPRPNFRVLPWSPTDVTFMELTGGADFAVTGPLQGCTIAVVRHAGSVWFFHANVGVGGGVNNANRATKRQMI